MEVFLQNYAVCSDRVTFNGFCSCGLLYKKAIVNRGDKLSVDLFACSRCSRRLCRQVTICMYCTYVCLCKIETIWQFVTHSLFPLQGSGKDI